MKPIDIANRAIRAVYFDTTVSVTTGMPRYRGNPVDINGGIAGMVPADIEWTADRGNWMWDGVCAVLVAMGVDVTKPLSADDLDDVHFELGYRRAQDAAGNSYDEFSVNSNVRRYRADPAAFVAANPAWFAEIAAAAYRPVR